MKKQFVWLLAAMMAVLIVGCGNQKEPAEKAVADGETALSAAREMAQKYVPDQLQSVEAQLAGLKDSLAKGDYKGVMAGVPAFTAALGAMKDAASAKAADAEDRVSKAKEAWESASTDVPKMMAALQSRLDVLAKSRHLPAGVTKDAVSTAKSGMDSLKSAWGEAMSASGSGDFMTAMTKASQVKDKAGELMKSLGMTTG